MTSVHVHLQEPNWFVKQWQTRPERCWLGLILALAFVLRIIRLGTWPYWHDEVFCLLKAEYLGLAIRGEFMSNHPPFFAVLVAFWRAVGLGDNEWTMRLLPLFLGLAGIAMVYFLGKELFDARAGLIAAFLLAIAPFHVLHSQDLKPYVLLPVVVTAAIYFLWRATQENRPTLWAAYGLTACAACYAGFFAGPLLVAVNLWFLATVRGRTDRLPGWCLANICGALLFVPFLSILVAKMDNIMISADVWWVPKPEPKHVVFYLKTVVFGYAGLDPHWKIALVIFSLAALTGFLLTWLTKRRVALLLLFWLVMPVAIVYVVSLFTNSIFLARAMLPYALPYYLFTGVALARLPRPVHRAAAIAVFVAIAALPVYQRYAAIYHPKQHPHRPGVHPPRDYDVAAFHILENWQDGDVVVHASGATWLPFYWYGFDENPHQYSGGLGSEFMRVIIKGNPRHSDMPQWDAYFPQEVQGIVEDKTRVWYVFSEWERGFLKGNAFSVWRWLDLRYAEVGRTRFTGIDVFLYESERDGVPIVKAARDRDDGVTAEVTYGGGLETVYLKEIPDAGLVASPVSERRGSLMLRFEDQPAEAPVRLATAEETRLVSFAIENHADRDIRCVVDFMDSDALVEIASLLESNPESDQWFLNKHVNIEAMPETYEIPVYTAVLSVHDGTALVGEAPLAPGYHTTHLYMLGSPLDLQNSIGDFQVEIGGTDIAAAVPRNRYDLMDWHWFDGKPVFVPYGAAGPTPVRITASPAEALPNSWVNVGYVAFRKVSYPPMTSQNPMLTPWPGTVVLPAKSTTVWSAEIDAERHRVDVWAFERGEGGLAYRIFKTWTP